MDAKQRISHLTQAAFKPPFAGSFADYADALGMSRADLVASLIKPQIPDVDHDDDALPETIITE